MCRKESIFFLNREISYFYHLQKEIFYLKNKDFQMMCEESEMEIEANPLDRYRWKSLYRVEYLWCL